MPKEFITYYSSPIGIIEIGATLTGINKLIFTDNQRYEGEETPLLQSCINQLDEYFKGKSENFSLKLDLNGTDFQQKVWNKLLNISFGKTTTYLKIARKIGDPNSVRAVGAANGKNPVSIIVPCHRVIGEDGSLTGYAGGIWRKKWLLEHEQKLSQLSLF